jgi:hypothetical protein
MVKRIGDLMPTLLAYLLVLPQIVARHSSSSRLRRQLPQKVLALNSIVDLVSYQICIDWLTD